MKYATVAAAIVGAIAGAMISYVSASPRPANIFLFAGIGATVAVALYLIGRRI